MMKTTFFYFFWYLLCQKRVFGCVFDDLTGLLITSQLPQFDLQQLLEGRLTDCY